MGFRETDQQQTKGVLRIDSFELWSSNKLTTDALHGIHNAATPPVAVGPGYGDFMLNFITPVLQLWTSSGPYEPFEAPRAPDKPFHRSPRTPVKPCGPLSTEHQMEAVRQPLHPQENWPSYICLAAGRKSGFMLILCN